MGRNKEIPNNQNLDARECNSQSNNNESIFRRVSTEELNTLRIPSYKYVL